jgi:hypothetical protein
MSEATTAATVAASDLLSNSGAPAAPPPPPSFMPAGFPVTPPAFNEPAAVAARATIEERKGDKDFYKLLVAERERGVTGPACQEWAALHKAGYPSPAAITSQADVDNQAAGRNAQLWDEHIANLKTRFDLTAEQEKEIRGGVVDERAYKWAVDEKSRLIKDKGFYRKLLDGDRAANRDWGLITSILSLRPVRQ